MCPKPQKTRPKTAKAPRPPVLSPANLTRLRREVLVESRTAFAARVGCHTRSVFNWEHGLHSPSGPARQVLMALLATHADRLKPRKGYRLPETL